MNGLEAYTSYLAVRNHFKTDYDYFKYNGKIKVNEDKFRTRRDHYQFEKLARIYDREKFIQYLVANFIQDEDYILGMSQGRAMMNHKKWQKNIESFNYQFKEDIQTLREYHSQFDSLFITGADGEVHPFAFKLYLREKININTLVVLNKLINYSGVWSKQENTMLNDFLFVLNKYTPFMYSYVSVDETKCKQTILEVFK
jgi:RNA recognition motif-containing protein